MAGRHSAMPPVAFVERPCEHGDCNGDDESNESQGWARARRLSRGAEGGSERRHCRRARDFRRDEPHQARCGSISAQGYRAVAPAMFDRIKRNITLEYSEIQQGIEYMQQLKWPNTLADLEAAANEVRAAGSAAVVGYCWGRAGRARRQRATSISTQPCRTTAAVWRRCSTRNRVARSYITLATRTRRFRYPTLRRSRRPIPRARCSSTAAPATDSIATSVPATARWMPKSHSIARSSSLEEQA